MYWLEQVVNICDSDHLVIGNSPLNGYKLLQLRSDGDDAPPGAWRVITATVTDKAPTHVTICTLQPTHTLYEQLAQLRVSLTLKLHCGMQHR